MVVQVLCESDAREWAGRNRSTMTRKRRRHTPDQIIRKLAERHKAAGRRHVAGGGVPAAGDRRVGWHRWLAQYGGMKANDAKRLRELEGENARLKKLLAEAELDKSMLKELAEGNF